MADQVQDWNQKPEFFEFTRGRFVSDEAAQVVCRRVHFDMNELAKTAALSMSARRCIDVEKCPDRLYNKAFIFTLEDGRQIVGKVPNPIAGLPHFTTASEVATLDFLRNVLHLPVPQVYAWSSRSDSTPVGAEYILMEKIQGVPLREKWQHLAPRDKVKLFFQIDRYQQKWTSTRFPKIGSLYYRRDLLSPPPDDYLFQNNQMEPISMSEFAVGPAVGREWVEHGRQSLVCDRGPFRRAVGSREIQALDQIKSFPKLDVMICGPKLYVPTKNKKLSALQASQALLPFILPQQPEHQFGYLWHNDLHDENIFVDPQNPTTITGIIDWQSTQILPLYDHILEPCFLEYSGPELGDALTRPELPPNVNSLPLQERKEVTRSYIEQSLMVAWRRLIKNNNPLQYSTLQFGNTTLGNLLSLGRRLFSLGEAHFLSLLLDLKNEWRTNPAVHNPTGLDFPVLISESDAVTIKEDERLADEGIRMMSYTAREFGDLWPNKGLIQHDQYERAKSELRDAKNNLSSYLQLSSSEQEELDRYWPFDS
ncbi:phosphotransferase enzyme family protein [Lindgomyces ingoldianus]|uniref:Phosphotransferase enzyme family protein n=1 Tax=Lindgomyces ingoldianus TaxID=673940 RepID=A0ACB6R792_9PLEO|nr:phosphotransferase enzyme family protein [Lindgomyces ingoldianus]KAF2475119.1 phosphotransferase enzyme family protein [Lindgomyces ingoldianus]